MNGSFTEIKQAHLKTTHRNDLNGHRAVFPVGEGLSMDQLVWVLLTREVLGDRHQPRGHAQ